ncbi:MAG TPA: hypothetical protein VN253_12485 [Kofleriaceae bacterium]|nr:hypothetical protein [Kofleriaceae bacterium]
MIAFCEAPADFRITAGLVDRVLREQGPAWVTDNFESPDVIRTWQPDVFGRAYFDLHDLNRYMDRLGIRSIRGHFNGRSGGPGGSMTRKALVIARALSKQTPGEPIDAVVLVWDTDQQREERPAGVAIARDEARSWVPFQIVCGFPDPEREAWVLAGFDPCDDLERSFLDELHRDLGFSPVVHAVRLRDPDDGALRSIKRVLRKLTGDDSSREERCWIETALDTLRARGADTGLAAFLDEIEHVLLPLLDPGAAERRLRESR